MIPGSLNTMMMGGGGNAIQVLDTFTGTDGTQLTSHTIDISPSPWVNASIFSTPGAYALIAGNQAYLSVDNSAAVLDAGVSDCIIEVDWTPGVAGSDRNSIIFRYQDDANMLYFNVRDPNGDCQVTEYASGSTVISNTSFAWTGGVKYHITIELAGSSIVCKVDDVIVISTSSSFLIAETSHGIARNTGSNNHRFDDFMITV